MNRAFTQGPLFGVSCAIVFAAFPSQAQEATPLTAEACITAHETAMALRGQSKLRAARDAAAQCTNGACPQMIRESCVELGETLVNVQPSILVRTVDATGNDVDGVSLTIDGESISRLEGTPIDVDPGSHTARFERDGYLLEERTFVVQEGEKRRAIDVTLKPVSAPSHSPSLEPGRADTSASLGVAAPLAQPSEFGTWRTVGLVTAGAGVLGLGAGVVMFVLAKGDRDDSLEQGCDASAVCSTQQGLEAASDARLKADWGTGLVYGGGGLVLAGAAVYLIDTLSHGSGRADTAHAFRAVRVAPQLGLESGGVSLSGRF
jgi:hypothetical protein